MTTARFWYRDEHARRRPYLVARARIVAAFRAWFTEHGFLEVEPAALQVSPGNETHLHAFATDLRATGGGAVRRYLHTSPEFAMKKLLAAGEEKIVAFADVFRNREQGVLHAPEFTMIEWYRAGAPYEAIMADCAALIAAAAAAVGAKQLTWRGRAADPFAEPENVTVAEAFRRHAGIDLAATGGDRDAFGAVAHVRTAADDTWSDIFSRVLSEKIEPHLGLGTPAFLTEYPASEAALARLKRDDPTVAERFELYACGVELANGFAELTDSAEQRRRFAADMDEKARIYGERYPLDDDFLAALAHMPPASGVALGLDRLVMLLTGAATIGDVQWTPVDISGTETA
ncbi:MAG TPA: EF-P lysine aminoacylase EpmA [Bauldia sp.]|nr:EF-P lysine aminoacylase EpmA [Bauldia sp.]